MKIAHISILHKINPQFYIWLIKMVCTSHRILWSSVSDRLIWCWRKEVNGGWEDVAMVECVSMCTFYPFDISVPSEPNATRVSKIACTQWQKNTSQTRTVWEAWVDLVSTERKSSMRGARRKRGRTKKLCVIKKL